MTRNTKLFLTTIVALLSANFCANAAEAVYRIVEYNKTTGEFTLAASGMVPKDSWAFFENDYGATTGNRYNQIPRNKKASLYLEGWKGCEIKSITLSMCSNNKSGQVGLSLTDGETTVYTERPSDFNGDKWFGQWVSKDLNVYVDITKPLDIPALTTNEAIITLQGGTSEGSVYVNSITIEYEEPQGATLESPLGWSYEKLTKKSVLNEGDEIMIYRNGCAAADYDGMEKSQYLDAVAIESTSDVTSHDVLRFTLNKVNTDNLWTMTDQYGRQLGATGKQALAWNDGNTQWNIDLGYDGATIANASSSYGTMRYNAPVESYARFNVYTSTSLPLPFIYRKDKQKQPVAAQQLTFPEAEVAADLADGHLALCPTLSPTATTDKRILWTSDDMGVATVNGGFVTLTGAGQTTITATTHDGGAKATVRLTVTDNASGISSMVAKDDKGNSTKKILKNSRIIIKRNGKEYDAVGKAI